MNHDYTFDEGVESVNVGSSLSLGYQMGKDHTIQMTGIYSSVAEDTAVILRDTGKDDADGQDANQLVDVDENIRHRERLLATVQLRGEHLLESANDSKIDWLFASTFTRQYDPDTRYFRYELFLPEIYGINAAQIENGNGVFPERNWQTVEDEAHQGAINFKIPFDTWNEEKEGFVKFGPYVESLHRDYDISRYQYTTNGAPGNAFFIDGIPGLPGVPPDPLPNEWFDEDYNTVGLDGDGNVGWLLAPGGTGNIDYEGDQLIHAIYLMGELPLTQRLAITGGVRLERTEITTEAAPQGLSDTDANPATPPVPAIQTYIRQPGTTKFTELTQPVEVANINLTEEFYHPAVAITYEAVDDMYFRAAWSKTTARPTFRELAPTVTVAVDDNTSFVGNPGLRMSESYNYDFRWEWFP
ncbi:MAG: TonB-dependent receptor, partial [Verrucomicrobiae bacterium]|nr:TonB-dependent receptor [Verrucomicrobiae bacterium]